MANLRSQAPPRGRDMIFQKRYGTVVARRASRGGELVTSGTTAATGFEDKGWAWPGKMHTQLLPVFACAPLGHLV